ncbi:MAG: protein translocase subunit SecF [Gammaproteobacteria bacterium]|nr:protein translocase subunit SecF [Gammaproteobacteria bacterium]
MQLFRKTTSFNFLGWRKTALIISGFLIVASIASLTFRGLNFGIDFTGGTLVEVGYPDAVEIEEARNLLIGNGFEDAVVQHFGTPQDILVRLPSIMLSEDGGTAELSSRVMDVLREPYDETLIDTSSLSTQQCVSGGVVSDCRIQMRRVEFVGPQIGDELANQGGLAVLYALLGILIYVTFRFEWRFAVGSIVALIHDVVITVGMFALLQLEFSLPVLAAVLAVIGYSLNDTIVVCDRIRENFRKMRKSDVVEIMNRAINQTLPRTLLTSLTTLLVVGTLLILGGEVIRGFSFALLIGVLIGTYSSIFVASPTILILGIKREDMLPVQKEGKPAES